MQVLLTDNRAWVQAMTEQERIAAALEFAHLWGGFDGEHHKAWCIDQMVRILTGDKYDEWVIAQKAGEDGPETYNWDEGIPP